MLFDWILVALIFAGPASFGCVEPHVIRQSKEGCQNVAANDEKNLLYRQSVFFDSNSLSFSSSIALWDYAESFARMAIH